jgi:hypothetical protein
VSWNRYMIGRLAVIAAATLVVPPAATNASAAPVQPAPAPSICVETRMAIPDGAAGSWVNGGDRTGRYIVGGASFFDGSEWTHAVLKWVNLRPTVIDTSGLAPNYGVTVKDVNSRGVVVGDRSTTPGGGIFQAWMHRGGRFTILPGLTPTDSTQAVAINTRGDIVGTSLNRTTSTYHPVIWSVGRPDKVRELIAAGEPPGQRMVMDVDDDGTVLGYLGLTPGGTGYVWPPNRTGYRLRAPAGTSEPQGAAIRDGWVAGGTMMPDEWGSHSVVARWNLRTGSAKVISTEYGAVSAVNRYGTVAANGGAFLHLDGRVVPFGNGRSWPFVLTDRGWAAGNDEPFGLGNAMLWIGC